MTRKKKIISVPVGNVQKLAKAHKCSQTAVYNALAYTSDSVMAQLIRKEAVELYGGVIQQKVVFTNY